MNNSPEIAVQRLSFLVGVLGRH